MTRATILIPAHNEASVIGRTLLHLSRGMCLADFHIVVIANACSDATASKARSIMPGATVIETATPGKANALNLGYAMADKNKPVICLDADLDITSESLEALIAPLCSGEAKAACGHMDVNASDAAALVRAYYKGWRTNPYFDRGKFGGVFALTPDAAAEIFPLPEIIADDEFVRRRFNACETAVVETCRFVVRAPRTVQSLVRVRRRALRGARAVTAMGLASPERRSITVLFARLLRQPRNLFPVMAYAGVNILARLQLSVEKSSAEGRWERDLSTRAAG
jgi:glycosyltransferase involved in cell wall biosynthesis